MKKRVGILTSGGDCPGLNATIRGVAKALYAPHGRKGRDRGHSSTAIDGLITGELQGDGSGRVSGAS